MTQVKKHAKLSASGSERWLNCPGSVKAEEGYKDTTSIYAEIGSTAHGLAESCMRNGKAAEEFIGSVILGHKVTEEMAHYVQEYLDYVASYVTENSQLYIEERVDYSHIVQDQFGTLDAAVHDYDKKVVHIFDLKYGKGVVVSAENNTQAQMYALAFYNELMFLDKIEKFVLHIVQPRASNYSQWEISTWDLMMFGKYAKGQGKIALSKDAPRIPGERQCKWCKAKSDCRALSEHVEKTIGIEFKDIGDPQQLTPELLNDEEKRNILDARPLIDTFIKSISGEVTDRITAGEDFPGYKLIYGRSVRKWSDGAEEVHVQLLGNSAYDKKLLGIVNAQRQIGKEKVDSITEKPKGRLTLVPESDPKPAAVLTSIVDEMEDVS